MTNTLFKRIINYSLLIINSTALNAQLKWTNVDSLYQPLPSSVHVYFTNEPIDTAPFRAYYLIADLKDKKIILLQIQRLEEIYSNTILSKE
jgi:hypothetical protein